MYIGLWTSGALTVSLGLWALYFVVVDRAVILKQLVVAGVVEAVLLVVTILVAVAQFSGYAVTDPITLWGYLLTCLLLLPVGGAWALVDRTRMSSLALFVICFSLAVCEWRVWQVWIA